MSWIKKPGFWLLIFCVTSMNLNAQESNKQLNEMIAEYQYPTNYLDINDSTRVAYLDEGSGDQTLIFIHGLATYLPAWYKSIDGLKKSYRCISIDLPGYGRSSKGDYPSTMTYYSGIVNSLIDQLELKNVVLVGHSMGGQIATTTALRYPDKFKKLILLAPAGFETFNDQQKTWLKSVFTVQSIINSTEEQIRANWALNFYEMPEEVEFMIQDRLNMKDADDFDLYAQSVVRGVHGMLDEPIFERLSELKQKTLVVYGANDRLIPNRFLNAQLTTEKVASLGTDQIPDVVLKLIPDCGHFISFDKPDEINEIMADFLTD
ncbi:MAG: alpha/beta hydrolase [bacterium]|nr:alpha/beta hydrolase [bacterium]